MDKSLNTIKQEMKHIKNKCCYNTHNNKYIDYLKKLQFAVKMSCSNLHD